MDTQKALSDLRAKHGLTQDEMAEKLFVTRQAVSRWENGKTTPNVDTLKLISKEFNLPISVILGDSQEIVCQSCAMPLRNADDFGTNSDGGVNVDYCSHCYRHGDFTHDRNMEEMIETNLRFLDEFNKENGLSYSEEDARAILGVHLATLKRWKKG